MKVFISCAANDKGIAQCLSKELENHKKRTNFDLSVYFESSSLESYKSFLNSSDAIIAILSKHSFSSKWVRKEIDEAIFNERFKNKFFPVLLSNSADDLKRIPWVLRKIRHLTLSPSQSEHILGKKIADEFFIFLERGNDHAS